MAMHGKYTEAKDKKKDAAMLKKAAFGKEDKKVKKDKKK